MPTITDLTDPSTWVHLCAMQIQELSPTHSNARSDAIACGLRDTWPQLTPVEAAIEFFRLLEPAVRFDESPLAV